MQNRLLLCVAACAALVFSIGASAQPPRARANGYLGADGVPDFRTFLAPPPAAGSPLEAADVAVYRATRALKDTPRWRLAASDAEGSPAALLRDFSCGLGVSATPADAPATARVLARAGADLGPLIGPPKDLFGRPRPFVAEPLATCVAGDNLAASGSYPSGHAAVGWLHALVLAELAPSRSAEILARGRTYGESRVVCGMHWVSDIEAGRTVATALFAALHGAPEYAADVAAARAELAALQEKTDAPNAAQCATEQQTLARPW